MMDPALSSPHECWCLQLGHTGIFNACLKIFVAIIINYFDSVHWLRALSYYVYYILNSSSKLIGIVTFPS